jgi:RHS repeat-associated protein
VTQYNWFTSDGRLDSTTYSPSSVDQKLGAFYSYDLLGRLGSRTNRSNNLLWSYGYDPVGEVTQYGTYRMGSLGNCDPSVEFCPPADWLPIALEEYGYDASGNRTDRGAHMEIGGNRYTDFDGFALNYDAEGNLTRKFKSGSDQTFTWNSLGQLTSVTTNGNTVSYGYDGHGVRVRRTANGQSQYYVYDGDDLLLELDQNGNPLRTYTHWPGTDNPHSVRVTSFGQNFLYYYTSEHPGNVTGLLSTFGSVAGEHHYKPFGEVESSSDDAGQPLRFMGRELDFATGLYYVRNRWYDPTLARFVSQDPIGLAGGLNTYAYVENDPLNGRDPSGLRNTRDTDPVKLDPIVACAKLWSWGWDTCDSDYIFDLWARQRREQDTAVRADPVSMGNRPAMAPPPPANPNTIGPHDPAADEFHRRLNRASQMADCRFFTLWSLPWVALHSVGGAAGGPVVARGNSAFKVRTTVTTSPGGQHGPFTGHAQFQVHYGETPRFDSRGGTSMARNYGEEAQSMAAEVCAGL